MQQCVKRWLDHWPDLWLAECATLSLSFWSILGICWLLHRFDGTPNRKWNNVTLNAAVSTLTTLARGMVLLAMAACLGQYKWIWFNQQHRPLSGFEIINEASRGLAGSVRLMVKTTWRFFVRQTKWRRQVYVLLRNLQWIA